LTKYLGNSLKKFGLENLRDAEEVVRIHPVLVGGGMDDASVNIAQHNSPSRWEYIEKQQQTIHISYNTAVSML